MIKELKGFESIELAALLGKYLRFFEEDYKQFGARVSLMDEENYTKFYEDTFANPWLYAFSQDELDLILSFFLDGNGMPLNEKNLDYSCFDFVENYMKPLFDKVFFMKVVKPRGFDGFSFEDAVKQLVKVSQPSQIELKSVFELMMIGGE